MLPSQSAVLSTNNLTTISNNSIQWLSLYIIFGEYFTEIVLSYTWPEQTIHS